MFYFYFRTQYFTAFCILSKNANRKDMKKRALLIALIVLPFLMTSCSKEDGDWDPMKWITDVKTSSDGYIHLPSEGGTLTFWCVNYSSVWLINISESEAEETGKKSFDGDGKKDSIQSNWMTAKSEGNVLTITVLPTTSDDNRFMELTVENGDVFDQFKIKQTGMKTRL